jgi:hypothetical protein
MTPWYLPWNQAVELPASDAQSWARRRTKDRDKENRQHLYYFRLRGYFRKAVRRR